MKQTRQEIISETIANLENCIAILTPMLDTEGFVVVSENHIAVNCEGINGTGFGLKNAGGCQCARIFKSEEDAYYNGMNFYAQTADNKPLHQQIRKASEVFAEVLEETKAMIEMFKNL